MRFNLLLAAVLLPVLVTDASAQGCRRPYGLGSRAYSRGINAIAPSRAITDPCSSMYAGRSYRRIKRHYPGAVIRR